MLKLLYCFHIVLTCFNPIRAGQKAGVLRRVATKLNIESQVTILKAHVCSVMEYASLTWMSAQPSEIRGLDQGSCLFSISHLQLYRQTSGCCRLVQAAHPPLPHAHPTTAPCPLHHMSYCTTHPTRKRYLLLHARAYSSDIGLIPTAVRIWNFPPRGMCWTDNRHWSPSLWGQMNRKPPDHTVNRIWLLNCSEPYDWSANGLYLCISLGNWSQSESIKKSHNHMSLLCSMSCILCNFATDKCTKGEGKIFSSEVKWN